MKRNIVSLRQFIKGVFVLLSCLLLLKPAAAGEAVDGGWYDSLWVSPAGDMALFMYSRYDFFPTILNGKKPVLSGTALPGHHSNDVNPWDDSDLYFVYKMPDGKWSTPINMPTNDDKADCCAMIAGQELFLQKGTDIYHARYINAEWVDLNKLPINSNAVDTNPHFDAETQILYWSSNRAGNFDIWQSHRHPQSGEWSKPSPVTGGVNTSKKEDQPFVSNGQMRFSREGTSGNMLSTQGLNGQWSKAHPENLGTQLYHAEVSLSQDENTAWFVEGDLKKQTMRFMTLKKNVDGQWGQAEKMW